MGAWRSCTTVTLFAESWLAVMSKRKGHVCSPGTTLLHQALGRPPSRWQTDLGGGGSQFLLVTATPHFGYPSTLRSGRGGSRELSSAPNVGRASGFGESRCSSTPCPDRLRWQALTPCGVWGANGAAVHKALRENAHQQLGSAEGLGDLAFKH